MLRLRRYLIPYFGMFALSVVLLFLQANLDLALPDYLSRIVNTGIQQNGIEGPVPTALRQETREQIALFLPPDERATVLDAYQLVAPDSAEADEYRAAYPLLEREGIYILTETDPTQIESLEAPLSKALFAVAAVQRLVADPAAAAEMAGALGLDVEPGALPPGVDLWDVLAALPEEQRSGLATILDEQAAALGDSALRQAAILQVKIEYEALGVDLSRLQNETMVRIGAAMLGITLLSAVATISVGYLSARTAAGLGRDLRRDVFTKVESFSNVEFDRFSTASLITRSTNDVNQLQMVTMMVMRMVFYAPIMGVGGILRAVSKGSSMGWIIAVAVLVLIGLIVVITMIAVPKFRLMQTLIDRLNLVARENLSGLMVIRAFNRQEFEEERFDRANQDLTANTLFISRVMAVMMPLMMLILNVMTVVILWIGSEQVAQANMQVGDMMAFMQYAMLIVMSFLMLSFLFFILPRASVSAERIAEVLEIEPVIRDPETPQQLPAEKDGIIEFRDVSFRYPGAQEDVLHDISFTALPGQMTAFIGSTGSGKSTVVNLIPRFYDVTGGAILVNGVDIRMVSQYDLREKIGYVPQKGNLFSGTIASNLRHASESAEDAALVEALETAQAEDFVFEKLGGLEAPISQGGSNVSGGQKQRLSIARALVKKPPIFIFDDSFSALDFKTDAALRRALREKTRHSTLLIVTQRIATVKNADQILVLDEGRLVGKGRHEELMQTCETYREIALSQLSLEELS